MILRFGLDGSAVAVEVPDPGTARDVGGLFSGYLMARAGAKDASARLRVRRREEGYRIAGDPCLLDGEGAVAVEDRVELLSRIEFALTRALLAPRSGWPHLHAAGAATDSGGVLALGPAGAGKSSLALAWSVAGHRLLGDDVVFVDPDGRARPFRRLLKVDPERLREHGLDPEATPHWSEAWERAWFDPAEAGAGWCHEPVRPRIVAFLRREPSAELRAEEVEHAEALSLLLSGLLGTGSSRAASVDALGRLLEGVRPVRLVYGESSRAADFLANLALEPSERAGDGGSRPRSGAGAGEEEAATPGPSQEGTP